MKEREMKTVKDMIKRGEGKHRYDGDEILFRLSIDIPTEDITKLIKKLKILSIVPRAIFKTQKGLTIEWWAMNIQMILDENNYIRLIEEFLGYVETIGFSEWKFDIGCLGDDVPTIFDNSKVIVNPRFTVENFNNTGEIEIFD